MGFSLYVLENNQHLNFGYL